MTNVDPNPSIHSQKHIQDLIQSLSQADWRRLLLVATRLASTLDGVSAGDVLQEALDAALGGRRRCPADVTVVSFLCGAMRSELSNLRKKAARVSSLDASTEPFEGLVVESPEEELAWMSEITRRVERIADAANDDRVLLILQGRAEGMSRDELRGMLELNWTEFESLERQIRRLRDRIADEERTA